MADKKADAGKCALNTVVGKGSVLEGSFEVHGGVRVDGALRGQLTTSGTLVVGPSGVVEADPVRVRDAVVAGRVLGRLEASHLVKLESSAVLVGDVMAKVLIIEEGAVLRGFCEAGRADDGELAASTPQEEPAKVKQVVG